MRLPLLWRCRMHEEISAPNLHCPFAFTPNAAAQARRGQDARYGTETLSRRYLKPTGSAVLENAHAICMACSLFRVPLKRAGSLLFACFAAALVSPFTHKEPCLLEESLQRGAIHL